jgi:hypothetical protein
MDEFCRHFEDAIHGLRQQILADFQSHETHAGFRSVWEHFEDIVNPVLIRFLTSPPLSIPLSNITAAKSKSVYPDLKVKYRKKLYAIDVKSGEHHMNPWYDIGRLDTYEEKHLQKYAAEYCVTIRWRGREQTEVTDVYIEPTYKSVGYRPISNGVLYRPYDGKLRPKSWSNFEAGISHWTDIEHFKRGLEASRHYRRLSFIVEWYKLMQGEERRKLAQILSKVDKGEEVELDDDVSTAGNEGEV